MTVASVQRLIRMFYKKYNIQEDTSVLDNTTEYNRCTDQIIVKHQNLLEGMKAKIEDLLKESDISLSPFDENKSNHGFSSARNQYSRNDGLNPECKIL